MINLSSMKNITIPEGNVKIISVNNVVIWRSEPSVTLVSISAIYSGGVVPVDTNLNSLTGLTVTANYSDGTTSNITNYTLSGNIVAGENIITVSYEGKTTTFIVIGNADVLPGTYQEVEYLRALSSNETYINLGFAFDTKARILMEYTVLNNGVTSYPFGAAENSGKLRCLLSSPYSNKTHLYGSTGSAYNNVTYAHTENVKTLYEFVLEPGKLALTNLDTAQTTSITTQGTYTMSANLFLFAQNYNGTVRYGGHRQIGKFKYYDKNGTLICDLVPCYRKNDDVRGMYDLARKIFLTNTGTGTFSKGPDVVYEEPEDKVNLWDLATRTGEKKGWHSADTAFNYDTTKYYYPGSRIGVFNENAGAVSDVVIGEDSLSLYSTGAMYGITVAFQLDSTKQYNLKAKLGDTTRLDRPFYGTDNKYTEFEILGTSGANVNYTFTPDAGTFTVFVFSPSSANSTATFTGISLTEV